MSSRTSPLREPLASYRLGALAGVAAGGALALLAVGIRDRWPAGAILCLASAGAFATCLALALGWALEAAATRSARDLAAPPAELSDPRFPITATDPELATELLLASLTTHPPRPARGPAT